ncbi:unnamed protein product [Eruca vesicaria subsp. sativa]|uniref:Uncharacterized protein n=1 Tax=Eruca vesicaria subsp. sativa TaxID=29727 RepID=A0ABC8JAX2_ERUVS|nr:unnamed protein product [Eruca vesicaria subsp. sativa]
MNERFAINSGGIQNLQTTEEGSNLSNPQKLMLDAFKGAPQVPKIQDSMVGDGSHSKARKSLKFEEEIDAEEVDNKRFESLVDDNIHREEARKKAADMVEQDMNSALDDAHMMIEGELLSDSELLSEDWEEGEVPDLMEEADMEAADMEAENGKMLDVEMKEHAILADQNIKEVNVVKPAKKKGVKTGTFGGTTKKRIVQTILSPRKNKLPKGPMKNGGKDNGEGKKNVPKAKEALE